MRAFFGLFLMGLASVCGGCGPAGQRIDAAGSSFIDPMMQEWAARYREARGVSINYQSKGSTAGIKAMTARDVDFGCSDAPMTREQLDDCKERGGEAIHVPLVLGAIAIAYNLPELPDLILDGPTLIAIFTRKVTKWDDPAIKALNPGRDLPSEKISVARRDDGSGSTYLLSDYLTKVDPDGKSWEAGRGTSLKWHSDTVGCKGTGGVAKQVGDTRGAVGYIELLYAIDKKLQVALVKNRAGEAVKPEVKSVKAAAASADIPASLVFSITDPGPEVKGAYPISGAVYAVTYVKPPKAALVRDFLHWVTHEGQAHAEALHYVPLPSHLVKKIEAQLDQIK
jgi:phosphate transport system substrate-binding protein